MAELDVLDVKRERGAVAGLHRVEMEGEEAVEARADGRQVAPVPPRAILTAAWGRITSTGSRRTSADRRHRFPPTPRAANRIERPALTIIPAANNM